DAVRLERGVYARDQSALGRSEGSRAHRKNGGARSSGRGRAGSRIRARPRVERRAARGRRRFDLSAGRRDAAARITLMGVVRILVGVVMSVALAASPARAQSAQNPLTSGQEQNSDKYIRVGESHHIRQGNVEIHDAANKTDIYADLIEFFEDEDRAVATGNFVFSQGTNRISAERAEFNTKTMLGTFYHASGIAPAQPPRQQVRPGSFAPPPSSQETVVYFFGETVEKVGPKKYKITKGGFSTCVQPTPRWEMSASTLTLNVD